MRLLIDADSIVYASGFSAGRKLADGTRDPGPVGHSLQAVKQALGSLYEGIDDKVKRSGDKIEEVSIFLTGKNNYRDEIATIRPYKGNRDKTHKPLWYDDMRLYLVQKYGALVVHGYEADDAVAMAQHQAEHETTVICSIDKDLKTVPGLNYNFRTKTLTSISPLEAQRNFWKQVLTGDTTDNIGGCYKVGPAGAEAWLSRISMIQSPEAYADEATEVCLEAYWQALETHGARAFNGATASYALLENCRLLHMQEYPDQLWGFHGHHTSVKETLKDIAKIKEKLRA